MSCNKIPYKSLSIAQASLRALARRRGGSARVECAIYPCAEHHAFHLTSNRSAARNRWSPGH